MKYAIQVQEIHAETVIVDANSLEEAIKKTEEFNTDHGFDLPEITDMTFEASPYAKENGEATEVQLELCEELEDCAYLFE